MDYDLFIDGDEEWNKIASSALGMPIEKFARKTAKDPVQEHLRKRKQDWNEYVKKFIATLKAVKKGLNGHDSPELGIEGGKITEPLPSKVPELLNYLAGEFSKVTNEGRQIAQEQASYSEQLEQSKQKKALEKGASNRLSRLWTYVKMPFQLSDQERWIRKDLLVASVQIKKLIEDLDDAVLSKNKIPEAILLAQSIYTFVDNDIINTSKKLKDNAIKGILEKKDDPLKQEEELASQEPGTQEPGTQEPAPKINVEPDAISDIAKMQEDVDNFIKNRALLRSHFKNKIPQEINQLFKEIEIYIPSFNKACREKNLQEIVRNYNRINEKVKTIDEWRSKQEGDLNKLAASTIGRWMKRQRRSIFKNRMDSVVLNISQHLSDALKAMNDLQDLVERKGLSYIDLDDKAKRLTESLGQAFSGLLSLANIYNSETRTDKDKSTRPIQEGEIRKLRQMVLTWGADVR